ncbi:MAG: LamG domain-containing protein [Planctomycetes bacterium]|nr:LamG domain-containing protein [Planctomycetota bacterium]
MNPTRPLSLPLLLTLLTTPALAQSHQRTFVEPLPPQVLLQGHAPSAAVRIWKLGCVAGDDSVDDATFQQVIADARALEQANTAANHLQLLPQSGSSALTNFNLAFTVSSPPPGAAAAVTACEQYYESLLGSLHATGPVALTVQWGPLSGAAMATGTQAGFLNYSDFRANLNTWKDADDVLPPFLPPTTIPVRFDATSPTVTQSSLVLLSFGTIQATFPSAGVLTTPHATITVNSNLAWDYDPSNGITAGAFCFRSALIHEIGHALGFLSDVDVNSGTPTALDLFRFRRTTDNPAPLDYADFQTHARLVDFNAPDDDAELDLVLWEYAMSDGAPYQGAHFREETPSLGTMDPVINAGETHYPDYLAPSDLRVLDALGFDWNDPNLDGLATTTSFVTIDENPSTALSNRFRIQYSKRVGPVTTGDFSGTAFFTPTTTSVVPDRSNAFQFDGTTRVDFAGYPLLTTRGTLGWTVELWFRAEPVTLPSLPRTLISFGTATTNQGVSLQLDANNDLILSLGGASTSNLGVQPNDGTWHHLALRKFVGLGGGILVYRDGVPVGSNFGQLNLQGGSCLIGANHATLPTNAFIGDLDCVRFYDVTLTDTDIAARRFQALPASTVGLIADFPLDVAGNYGVGSPALDTPNQAAVGPAGAEITSLSAPTFAAGPSDSATSFVVTVAHAATSGGFFCENDDDDSIRELRSGAPLGGLGNQGILSSPYTLQFAAGSSFCEGSACPCGNDPVPGTWVGCLSSIGQGARLRGNGSQSIANANLTLVGMNMPNSNALYLASTGQTSSVLGDGIFCLGGTIVRLGTKTNVGGFSQFPEAGQLPIATRVSATPGMTSSFQIWYRNSAAFCTTATFNDSNAWRVTWTP